MHGASRILVVSALTAACLALDACDDGERLTEPVPGEVLLDVTGTLEASLDARDTIDVTVPADRVMGVIFESAERIVARYGPDLFDVIHSGYGAPFAAIVPDAGTGNVRLVLRHAESEPIATDYRIRVVGVNDAPEHIAASQSPSRSFRTEWIDPPLDVDIFLVDFDEGERFYVEAESLHEDESIIASIVEPDGFRYYLFLEAGPEVTRSMVHETRISGEHALVVYSRGLQPDVEARYRFRIVRAGDQTEAPAAE